MLADQRYPPDVIDPGQGLKEGFADWMAERVASLDPGGVAEHFGVDEGAVEVKDDGIEIRMAHVLSFRNIRKNQKSR
jgi:hypothetical protein